MPPPRFLGRATMVAFAAAALITPDTSFALGRGGGIRPTIETPVRVTLDSSELSPEEFAATEQAMQSLGATFVSDYGGRRVFSVPDSRVNSVSEFEGVLPHREWNTLVVGSRTIDTARTVGSVSPGAGIKVIQFLAPPLPEDIAAVEATGCTIIETINHNGLLVWAGSAEAATALRTVSPTRNPIGYRADYVKEDVIAAPSPEADPNENVLWNLYLVNDLSRVDDDFRSIAEIPGLSMSRVYQNETNYTPSLAIATLNMPGSRRAEVLSNPTVVSLNRATTPILLGEPESMITAGMTHVVGGAEVPKLPSAGGQRYIPWLTAKLNAPNNPHYSVPGEYPVVVITDNGASSGNDPIDEFNSWKFDPSIPDFRVLGDEPAFNTSKPNRWAYSMRWNAAANFGGGAKFTTGDGVNVGFSHGHRIASLVGGYSTHNPDNNPAAEDARRNKSDLNYGVGISPYGRLGNVVLDGVTPPLTVNFSAAAFRNMITQIMTDVAVRNTTTPTVTGFFYKLFAAHPAVISTNSWGVWEPANRRYVYEEIAYEVDKAVRDGIPGGRHQGLLFVAAAGNSGAEGDNTIVSPAIAKNVIAVGMSESVHAAPMGANDQSGTDARNLDFSSSRGVSGTRIKPDLVAPGAYAYVNRRFLGPANPAPLSFTVEPNVYATDWGTSFSAPEVAGAAQVIAKFLRDRHGLVNPSPALLKSYLIMSAKFINGANTGTGAAKYELPTKWQGFGRVDLGRALDLDASGKPIPTYLHDQQKLLRIGTPSEQEFSITGRIADPTRPFRATLVWTDPVSLTNGGLIQNNLDLSVIADTGTLNYLRGNAFQASGDGSEAVSMMASDPGLLPPPDSVNNVEAIYAPDTFIPADTLTVKVVGATIPTDCYNQGGTGRQDFALVVYNFIPDTPRGVPAERIRDLNTVEPGEWAKDFTGAEFIGGGVIQSPTSAPAPANSNSVGITTNPPNQYGSWEISGTTGLVGGRIYRNIWTLDAALIHNLTPNEWIPGNMPWMRLRSGSSSNWETGQFESVFESTLPTSVPTGTNVDVTTWLAPKLTPDGYPLEASGRSFDRPNYAMEMIDRSSRVSLTATLKGIRTDSFARESLIPDPVAPVLANWGTTSISGIEGSGETLVGLTPFPTNFTFNFSPQPGTFPPTPTFNYSFDFRTMTVNSTDWNQANMWLANINTRTAFNLSNDRLYLVDVYISKSTIESDNAPILRTRFLPSNFANSPVNNFDLSSVGGANPAALLVPNQARRYTMAFQPRALPGVTHELHLDLWDGFSNRLVSGAYKIERVIVRSYLLPPVEQSHVRWGIRARVGSDASARWFFKSCGKVDSEEVDGLFGIHVGDVPFRAKAIEFDSIAAR